MKLRSIGSPLLAAGFLLSAFAFAMAPPEEPDASFSERARRVRVAEVSAVSAARTVRFSGVTRAQSRAELAFTVPGRLAERRVEVGQEIAEGAIIGRLDDLEHRHAVAAAEARLADTEARLAQAASERRRVEQLHAARAATSDELERATAAAEALAAGRDAAIVGLREARRLLAETVLAAPFAGTITEIGAERGEILAPGRTVVVLSGRGAVETEVRLPESVVVEIEKGDRVAVRLPMSRIATQGTVSRVGRAGGGAGRLFPVLVAIDDRPGLLPGMTAEVELELAEDRTLAVPLAAVLNPGASRPRVFRLVGDRVEPVEIEVGQLLGERVAVRADLRPGDEVVVTGHASLVPGDRVEVLR